MSLVKKIELLTKQIAKDIKEQSKSIEQLQTLVNSSKGLLKIVELKKPLPATFEKIKRPVEIQLSDTLFVTGYETESEEIAVDLKTLVYDLQPINLVKSADIIAEDSGSYYKITLRLKRFDETIEQQRLIKEFMQDTSDSHIALLSSEFTDEALIIEISFFPINYERIRTRWKDIQGMWSEGLNFHYNADNNPKTGLQSDESRIDNIFARLNALENTSSVEFINPDGLDWQAYPKATTRTITAYKATWTFKNTYKNPFVSRMVVDKQGIAKDYPSMYLTNLTPNSVDIIVLFKADGTGNEQRWQVHFKVENSLIT